MTIDDGWLCTNLMRETWGAATFTRGIVRDLTRCEQRHGRAKTRQHANIDQLLGNFDIQYMTTCCFSCQLPQKGATDMQANMLPGKVSKSGTKACRCVGTGEFSRRFGIVGTRFDFTHWGCTRCGVGWNSELRSFFLLLSSAPFLSPDYFSILPFLLLQFPNDHYRSRRWLLATVETDCTHCLHVQ